MLSKDPAKDGLNWYAYCENNPVSKVDPTGEISIPIGVGLEILIELLLSLGATYLLYDTVDRVANADMASMDMLVENPVLGGREKVKSQFKTITCEGTTVGILEQAKVREQEKKPKVVTCTQAALAARDIEVARICRLSNNQRRRYVAVAAGYNKITGEVAVAAKLEEKGMRTYCVEDMVVAQLILQGATLADIVMTPAIRPRTMEVIPVCKFCQMKYSQDNFIPGTPFE